MVFKGVLFVADCFSVLNDCCLVAFRVDTVAVVVGRTTAGRCVPFLLSTFLSAGITPDENSLPYQAVSSPSCAATVV